MRLIDTEQTEKRWFTELHGNFKDDYAKGFQAGLLAVIRQEAIEAEQVRHGRWIKNTDGIYSWIECSECGGCPPRDIDGKIVLSEYCHHCGAKMDGGDEE